MYSPPASLSDTLYGKGRRLGRRKEFSLDNGGLIEIFLNKYIRNTRIWIMDHPGDKYTCLVTFRIILDILWDLWYDALRFGQ